MEDQIINIRLTAIEARQAAIEGRLAALEQASTANPKRRKKELTPEQRLQIRQRLVAGQKAKREREAAEAVAKAAEAKKAAKKEAKNGTSAEAR